MYLSFFYCLFLQRVLSIGLKPFSKISYSFFLLLWAMVLSGKLVGQVPQEPMQKSVDIPIYTIDHFFASEGDTLISALSYKLRETERQKDTLKLIELLNRQSLLYCNRVDFAKSYDGYWKALLLAEKVNDSASKVDSYTGLGILYSLYERREKALSYYQKALDISKKLVQTNEYDSTLVKESYFSIAVHHKYDSTYALAHTYLDSCTQGNITNDLLIMSERAHVYTLEGKLEEAGQVFSKIAKYIDRTDPIFLTILYSYRGDFLFYKNQTNESLHEYAIALRSAHRYRSHLNFVPDIYLKIARIMNATQQYKKETDYLKLAHEINRQLYSSRSPYNRFLMEIKDKHRVANERNRQLAQEQELVNLRQEKQISQLRIAVLIVSLVFFVFSAIFLFYYWKNKHKTEKIILKQDRLRERRQSEEILNLKKSELASSALEIIAKDKLLLKLKEKLKKVGQENHSTEIIQLMKDIDFNKDQSWSNFETRFNLVNKGFNDNIKRQYPQLKPYDLKICILVKLGFSGKEMAQVLGISAESANTARYRLRKKMGLSKEDNLNEFINRFVDKE